jgi:hypothetical protein
MKRIFLCCGALVVACSLPALAWQAPRANSPEGGSPPPPTAEARAPEPPPPAKAATIDDLLNKLDSLKVQKAALEKAEKETVALLKEKLKQQAHRLKKLGVNVEEAPPAPAVAPLPPPAPTVAPPSLPGSLSDGPR